MAASPVRPGDLVLDLGAGDGALTLPLLARGARVLAVERHPGRAAALRRLLEDHERLRVVEVDLADLRLPARPFRVVASPPYALSTATVRALLGAERLLSADLVLQRAAVRRLVAAPPATRRGRRARLEEGLLLPRSAFRPPPRVDSAVLRVRR